MPAKKFNALEFLYVGIKGQVVALAGRASPTSAAATEQAAQIAATAAAIAAASG